MMVIHYSRAALKRREALGALLEIRILKGADIFWLIDPILPGVMIVHLKKLRRDFYSKQKKCQEIPSWHITKS